VVSWFKAKSSQRLYGKFNSSRFLGIHEILWVYVWLWQNKSPFTRFDIFTVSDIFSIRYLSVGVFRRHGNLTVHRTQPYTVLGFQLHSYRMRIKTHEDGLGYIYINIMVSQVSPTANDFKSKILGTSYCETKKYFRLF